MRQFAVSCLTLLALAAPAAAAPNDVIFKGGGAITSTSGCTNWNPDKSFFMFTYWVPVAGSTNGNDSAANFHFNNYASEGFQLDNDLFTTNFKTVRVNHVYTRNSNYLAFLKILSQSPSIIVTTTARISVIGTIQGWDNTPSCVVNFTASAVKDLQP